jgi:hypothetical protein
MDGAFFGASAVRLRNILGLETSQNGFDCRATFSSNSLNPGSQTGKEELYRNQISQS